MKCIKCYGDTYVVKTELLEKSDDSNEQIKQRRRVCRECHNINYTYEISRSRFRKLTHLAESKDELIRNELKFKNKRIIE